MKKILSFLLFLQIWSLVYAQAPNFEERINSIDEYASTLKKIEDQVSSTKQEIESYKNSKIIEKDQLLKGRDERISQLIEELKIKSAKIEELNRKFANTMM